MRKQFLFVLMVILCLGLAGCGANSNVVNPTTTDNVTNPPTNIKNTASDEMAASPESMTSEVSTTKQDDFCTMEDDTGREISLNMTKDQIEIVLGETGVIDETITLPAYKQMYDYTINHVEIIYQKDTYEAISITAEYSDDKNNLFLKPDINFSTKLDDIRKTYENQLGYTVEDPGGTYIYIHKIMDGYQYNRNIYYNENNDISWLAITKKDINNQ